MKRASLLFFCLSLCSCARGFLFQEVRSAYTVVNSDELIASNQGNFENFYDLLPRNEKGSTEFTYKILIKNNSKSHAYEIPLESAYLSAFNKKVPIKCSGSGEQKSNLPPEQYKAVTCTVRVTKANLPELERSDVEARISFPYSSDKAKSTIGFPYKLKIEDIRDDE